MYDSLFEPKSFDFEREESIVTVVLRMIDRGKANSFFFHLFFSLSASPINQVVTGKSHLSLLSNPQKKLRSSKTWLTFPTPLGP